MQTSKSVIQEQQSKLVEKTDLSLSIAFGAIGVLHLISTLQYFSCKQEIKKLQQENEQLKAELKILKKWYLDCLSKIKFVEVFLPRTEAESQPTAASKSCFS